MAIYYTGSIGNQAAVSQLPSCSRLFRSFYCVLFIELTLESSEKRVIFGTCSVVKNTATANMQNQQVWASAGPDGVRREQR